MILIHIYHFNDIYYLQSLRIKPTYKSLCIYFPQHIGFTITQKTRPLIISKLEEFFREKSVVVRSNRLIDELFVFIYNGNRAEAMTGYNDDLVMSYAMGLWIRETALRLRAEGIELQKKAMSSITSNQGVYTPTNNQNDSWTFKIGKQDESLEWLI